MHAPSPLTASLAIGTFAPSARRIVETKFSVRSVHGKSNLERRDQNGQRQAAGEVLLGGFGEDGPLPSAAQNRSSAGETKTRQLVDRRRSQLRRHPQRVSGVVAAAGNSRG